MSGIDEARAWYENTFDVPAEDKYRAVTTDTFHRCQEEELELIKVLFDMYDRDRDGMITVEEACLLCT